MCCFSVRSLLKFATQIVEYLTVVAQFFHVAQFKLHRVGADLYFPHQYHQRHQQANQTAAKNEFCRNHVVSKNAEHAHHAQKKAKRAHKLHIAYQMQSGAYVSDLIKNIFAGFVSQIQCMKTPHPRSEPQKAVGVSQHQQGNGRKQQCRRI